MSSSWKGVPIAYIVGSQSPWGAPEFPLVQPSYKHSVLYHIPSDSQLDRPPKPQVGSHKWDQEHVRLPFSSHSLYPVENNAGETNLNNRWDMVVNALNRPLRNSKELAEAILSYNSQFKNKWKFSSLHYLFEEYLEEEEAQFFFDVTLPEIVKLALALPKLIHAPIPLLKQNKNKSVSLSQQQISSLLANAFFCTFPRRNTTKKNSEYSSYPYINFYTLFECSPSDYIMEKLKCICHYFRRVCTKVPVGVVTVSRRSVPVNSLPDWQNCQRVIAELPVHCDANNTIEEAHGLIQVDFANKFLGGGVLSYGAVQEEIRFMICPELLISMLFTEELKPNEALMIIGAEQYSTYAGYGNSFSWRANHSDATPRDASGRRRVCVLAVDALPARGRTHEHSVRAVTRDLHKAWVGFSFYSSSSRGMQYPGVATGNWGCGAFGGSPRLKFLIQAMALTAAGRPLAYYTFGCNELRDDIIKCYDMLVKHRVTVGELYKIIINYCETDLSNADIYEYFEHVLDNRKPECNETSLEPKLKKRLKKQSTTSHSGMSCVEADQTIPVALDFSPDIFFEDEDQFLTPPKPINTNEESIINLDTSQSDTIKYTENKTPDTDSIMQYTNNKTPDSDSIMQYTNNKTPDSDSIMQDTNNKTPDSDSIMQDTNNKTPETDRITQDKNKTPEIKNKVSTHEKAENSKTNQTNRLFDEMEKLDEKSGKLNLKSPHKSFFGHKGKQDLSMEVEEKMHTDVSPDVKKKLTKKITDYFAKRPI